MERSVAEYDAAVAHLAEVFANGGRIDNGARWIATLDALAELIPAMHATLDAVLPADHFAINHEPCSLCARFPHSFRQHVAATPITVEGS